LKVRIFLTVDTEHSTGRAFNDVNLLPVHKDGRIYEAMAEKRLVSVVLQLSQHRVIGSNIPTPQSSSWKEGEWMQQKAIFSVAYALCAVALLAVLAFVEAVQTTIKTMLRKSDNGNVY